MTQNNPGRSHRISLLVVIGLMVLALGFFFIQKQQTKKLATTAKKTAETQINRRGELYLTTESDRTIFIVGDEVKVTLYGSTDGQEVGGYDAVLTLDTGTLKFEKAENLLPGWQLFARVGDNSNLFITGVKDLQSPENIILKKTVLAELFFTVVEPASGWFNGNIALKFTSGDTSDSNLITPKTEDILGKVGNLALLLGEQVTLNAGEEYTIANSSIKITVEPVATLPPVCNDCQTTVIVNVTNGTAQKKLKFVMGGIAGSQASIQQAYGYEFQIGGISRFQVDMRIAAYEK